MKVIADERRRVTLPKPARPGDVFELEQGTNGRLIVTKLVKPEQPTGKLVKRGRLLLLSSNKQISWEERAILFLTKAAIEFPANKSRSGTRNSFPQNQNNNQNSKQPIQKSRPSVTKPDCPFAPLKFTTPHNA